MVIHKEGDKSKAICEKCGKVVSTTFKYADFVVNGNKIPEVLQGFCDECGDSVSIPHQSTFRIHEYQEKHDKSFEVRVPPHYKDILLAIGGVHRINSKPNYLCRLVSQLYIDKMSQPGGEKIRRKVINSLKGDLAQGVSRDRLSCVLKATTYSTLQSISGEESKSTSEIIKGIILVAKHDILDKRNKEYSKQFGEMAAIY